MPCSTPSPAKDPPCGQRRGWKPSTNGPGRRSCRSGCWIVSVTASCGLRISETASPCSRSGTRSGRAASLGSQGIERLRSAAARSANSARRAAVGARFLELDPAAAVHLAPSREAEELGATGRTPTAAENRETYVGATHRLMPSSCRLPAIEIYDHHFPRLDIWDSRSLPRRLKCRAGYSLSNPWLVNFSVRLFSVTVRTI